MIKITKDFGPVYMPVTLIGSQVRGKANFMACGWSSRVGMNPPVWLAALGSGKETLKGISKNKTFSINYPGKSIIDKTDYCGLVSGKNTDKSGLFHILYGNLKTAPMIEDCPLCMELKLIEIKELNMGVVIFGEVKGTYTHEKYLNNGNVDINKMDLFLLSMPDANYRSIGDIVEKAWSIGKKIDKIIKK